MFVVMQAIVPPGRAAPRTRHVHCGRVTDRRPVTPGDRLPEGTSGAIPIGTFAPGSPPGGDLRSSRRAAHASGGSRAASFGRTAPLPGYAATMALPATG